MKQQIIELLNDGVARTTEEIASDLGTMWMMVQDLLQELRINGEIELVGNNLFARRPKRKQMPHLDDEVDRMEKSDTGFPAPNNEARFIPPKGGELRGLPREDKPLPDMMVPEVAERAAEPHWIKDAFGWDFRPEKDTDGIRAPGSEFLAWMGGKGLMVQDLVQWFPEHKVYVEVFGGSLKPFFYKRPSRVEVVNDKNTELINFWRVFTLWPEDLVDAVNNIPVSRTIHRLAQRERARERTPWERAVLFGYLVKASFSRLPWGSFGGCVEPPRHLSVENLVALQKRLLGAYIENLDFRTLIKRYNKKNANVFFYLDPPYYKTTGYADAFPDKWHEELAAFMVEIHEAGNKVLMTNSEQARSAYERWLPEDVFHFNGYDMVYTTAGSSKKVRETIISNYLVRTERQTGIFL